MSRIPSLAFTDLELGALAARAAPLLVRSRGVGRVEDPDRRDAQLARWTDAVSFHGDRRALARRLASLGGDEANAAALLREDASAIPPWATSLQRILAACSTEPAALPTWATRIDPELPFGDLFVPAVEDAAAELGVRGGADTSLFTADALGACKKRLLIQLSGLAGVTLSLELQLFLNRVDPLAPMRPPPTEGESPPRGLYARFVEDLRSGGLRRILGDYPVLARLLAIAVDHWIDAVCELCTRLGADRDELAATFFDGVDPGGVTALRVGLSDPHNGGRGVVSLTFASGGRVVYKPKDLGVDVAYFGLLGWLEARGCALPLRRLAVVNRGTHGWIEFAAHEPLADLAAADRFYRRIGMVQCVLHLLQATDIHMENIVACGDQPVVIDLETMMQAVVRPWDGLDSDSADARVGAVFDDSVLRSQLLPTWIPDGVGKSFDISGLGSDEDQETGTLHPTWVHVNTDRMRLGYLHGQVNVTENLPMLDGQAVPARDHVDAIAGGFEDLYAFMVAHRDALAGPDGPLEAFRGLQLRQVLRNTRAYGSLDERLRYPEFLRDGVDRIVEIERLGRAFASVEPTPGRPVPWGMLDAEVRAMEALDIPFFNVMSDGVDLIAHGEVVAHDFFVESGLTRARARFAGWGEADLTRQIGFLRASTEARWQERRPFGGSTDGGEALTLDGAVAVARELADVVRDGAVWGGDGSVAWLAPGVDGVDERRSIRLLDDDLYAGRLGVVFFLAALDRVTGADDHRDLVEAGLRPLCQRLRNGLVTNPNLGGLTGLGSQIYGLAHLGRWLDDPDLVSLAEGLVSAFTPARIAGAELGVVSGVAGGLLALLALASDGARAAAVRCGERLLDARVSSTPSGPRTWIPAWAEGPVGGFAHGHAGIAHALARLGAATGEARYTDAAREALAFESATEPGPISDRISDRHPSAWCTGAGGLALACLASPGLGDTLAIRRADRALAAMSAAPPCREDHLCCGTLGQLDVLSLAGMRLGRPELRDDALRSASAVIRRSRQHGMVLHAQVSGVPASPSLFHGLAGVGYGLLRLTAPERLPCVLTLEGPLPRPQG